jgi:septal ring factor EnvC (AmiA/AmiB activator)
MKRTKNLLAGVILILLVLSISSCDKKDEQQNLSEQKEKYSDKEKELKDKEDFLKIKEEQLKQWEERLKKIDSTIVASGKDSGTMTKDTVKTTVDSAKIKEKLLKEKKMEEKEKELNKRLDNPKVAVNDYLEYIQRGIGDSKTFDANMKKASEVWENRTADSFKKSYKNVKKFTITEEPKVVNQKGGNATVKVKVKQSSIGTDGKESDKESVITYNLVADKNGKWKIKSNVVK